MVPLEHTLISMNKINAMLPLSNYPFADLLFGGGGGGHSRIEQYFNQFQLEINQVILVKVF